MADGYERFQDSNGHGNVNGFVVGLFTGAVVGAALGVLFAPKAGFEMRNQLSDQAGKIKDQASRGYQRAASTANEWAEKGRQKGREAFDRTRDAISRGTEEAERYVRDTASGSSSTL